MVSHSPLLLAVSQVIPNQQRYVCKLVVKKKKKAQCLRTKHGVQYTPVSDLKNVLLCFAERGPDLCSVMSGDKAYSSCSARQTKSGKK